MTSYTPQPASPTNDRTTLFGVLGIIGAICCLPVGIVFGILSLQAAKRVGKQPTLAYIALALCALSLIWSIIAFSAHIGPYNFGRN